MNEERILRLEDENRQRAVDHARLSSSVEHLIASVEALTGEIKVATAFMNQGRGAAWAVMFFSALVGGAIAAAVTKWLGD